MLCELVILLIYGIFQNTAAVSIVYLRYLDIFCCYEVLLIIVCDVIWEFKSRGGLVGFEWTVMLCGRWLYEGA